MLMIRLARFGAKKKPIYRLVVIEKERARNGRALEVVGHYNPVATAETVHIKHDRVEHWTKNGAQPSDTVKRLVEKNPALRPQANLRHSSTVRNRGAKQAVSCIGIETLERRLHPWRGMKQLIEDIAKALVDIPERSRCREVQGNRSPFWSCGLRPGDLGKVIGKQGRTARSIRTMLGAAGMKLNRRFTLEILE